MSWHRGKPTVVEFDQVLCGNCAKEYPGPELKPVWQGDSVLWTCPSCGALHEGVAEGGKCIAFRLRPGIQP